MLIELRVIGEDEVGIEAAVEKLAEQFGVATQGIVFERTSEDTLVGSTLAERR